MCITVTNEHPEPTGPGYKVFIRCGRHFFGEYSGRRYFKKWLHCDSYQDTHIGAAHIDYDPGWHIYLSLADANKVLHQTSNSFNRVVRKVRYRGAFLSGPIKDSLKGEGLPVVVAKEILILPGEVK